MALLALVAALSLLLIAAQGASGQNDSRTPDRGPGTGESSDSSRFLRKAEQEGSVRVIVGLRTDFQPEGRLSRPQVADQRRDIASVRAELRADLEATGYRTVRQFETVPYIALNVSPEALRAAQNSPNVTMIREDRTMAPTLAESGPIVRAPEMWAAGYTGSGQTIAVIDTGVDSSHPFLSGRVVDEACYSGGSDCPNGSTSQTGPGSGSPCTYAGEGCKHGTHVAGIAAGAGGDFSGVARGANIVAIQVAHDRTGALCDVEGEDPCALVYDSDVIAGLEHVYELRSTHEFSSVNISIGGGQYSSYCDADFSDYKAAIDNLKAEGIATVISSGNSMFTDSIEAPACISSAVSVGATDDADDVAAFSNSASVLDLLAPGVDIQSSVPGGGFGSMMGTSMAAPHVAGAWALLQQQNPSASVDEILSALKNTGTPVKDDRVTTGVTKPRINIADALAELNPLANDDFAKARALVSSETVSVKGKNVGATRESGEPDHLPGSLFTGEHSLWYKWTAPITGRVTMHTCTSSFDTALAVYTGSSLNSLSQKASDDDSCPSVLGFNGNGSRATLDVTKGTSYRIAVSSFYADSSYQGSFVLGVDYTPPANDAFSGAQEISGSDAPIDGTNIGATRQSGEPDHLPASPQSSGEESVWYRWSAPASGPITLDTCTSDFGALLAVYTGSSLNALSPTSTDHSGCEGSSNGEKVTFDATAGTTYQIALFSGFGSGRGTFTLKLAQDVTPPRVKSVKPAGGATGVGPAANVRAVFSEAMLATTINADTFTLRKKGTNKKVSATVSYDPATKKAILNPEANLERGATYIARISPQATDEAGNHLDQKPATAGNQAKIWKFKVKP